MVIQNFSKKMIKSKIFDTYVAAVFFATLIFFVLNMNSFTPIEILAGVMLVTIAFKGIANIMFSMTISFVNFDNLSNAVDFEKSANEVETLVNELSLKQATMKEMREKSQNN